MNREQLFLEIDEIYSEWHGGDLHIGKERENRIKEVIQQAINYTHSCTELSDKEPTLVYNGRDRFGKEIWLNKDKT